MSIERRLTDDEVALACKLWAEGASELEVAQACGDRCMTTWRRRRRPGEQLESLQPRGHSERNSGRRTEEMTAPEIYERAARIRTAWGAEERQLRSLGKFEARPASPPAHSSPFPNHNLKVIAAPRHP